jgi:hypothetical protein
VPPCPPPVGARGDRTGFPLPAQREPPVRLTPVQVSAAASRLYGAFPVVLTMRAFGL